MAKRKKRNRGGGVPFNPDVDTGTKRPVTARVAVGDVNDKFSDYPSNGLTPRRLARIFREADEGNVRAQMELFEEMEEKDTHLFSQMQTRKLAVTGLDWEVQPFSEDEIDKEIADFIDEQLKGIENFDEVLIDMLVYREMTLRMTSMECILLSSPTWEKLLHCSRMSLSLVL